MSSSTFASEIASTVTAPVVFTAAVSPIQAEIVGFTVPLESFTPAPTNPAEIATVLTSISVSELAVTERLATVPAPLPICAEPPTYAVVDPPAPAIATAAPAATSPPPTSPVSRFMWRTLRRRR